MPLRKPEAIPAEGAAIVLTGPATDMSDFNLSPFRAFTGGFPTGIIPRKLLRKYWYPPVPSYGDGTAKYAPYGMRKIEALLVREFGADSVAVVHPNSLERVVGPGTKAIGISSMEPAGTGFVSRTYTSLLGFGGEPVAAAEFRDLVNKPVLRRWGAKIILGGSGAWQIHKSKLQAKYDVDCIVMGEGERTALNIFRMALNNERLPPLVEAESPNPEEVPCILRPSIFGTVEVTRGCGRGCRFCSPTMRRSFSFPLNHIMKEVQLNAKNGTKMIILASDDIFLYKSKKRFLPNREAVTSLIKSVAAVPGVQYIQPAHASLAPVVYDPEMVEEIGPILLEKANWVANGTKHSSVEIGIETGSIRLMNEHMKGKMLPYEPTEWHTIVTEGVDILNANGIWPLATLIVGLPGEAEEDTIATLDLLDELRQRKVFYVPLLFTSEEDCMLKKARHMDLNHLSPLQWDLIATCWERNLSVFVSKGLHKKIGLAAMTTYPLYYRWKHGSKVLRPMMKLAGWTRDSVSTEASV
ncbi:MAG: B12-binding domain-containing radical SAM protein [Candidatus Bathyarchaeota archaeon]|nr:MAG: B12-binding domain-containing radical SAM protein [Candidatus Bathyarchaeota archaeon]